MLHNVRDARVVEGGSTITQQVAKLLLGSQRRTFAQKARQTVIALRLEHRLSKREILALYLNLAPYGNRISGIARASRSYFGVAPAELTPAQAAYLAALPQRPSAFNPLRDSRRAMARQQYVLARMHDDGLLDGAALQHVRAERLRFDSGAKAVVAQHFIERVLASNEDQTLIRTTLDANLQRQVAGIIAANRTLLLNHGAKSVAVAVLDNATGEWLAWEGSGDYFGQGFGGAIDGVAALRQPGSTLKPFTYALAFERGMSPATVLPDIPSHFATAEEGVVYTPRNYDGRYRGPLRIRAALAGSENVPAVAMLNKLGPASLLRFLHAAGFRNLDKTADYYGLGLTLGDAEVSLEQLVTAYATLARGGVHIAPRFTTGARNAAHPKALLAKRTAFLVTDILSDPEAREFIFGSGGSLDFPFPVAVKTGTSQAYRDNWVLGYTREVTVGVWVGNFDRAELRNSTGITGAGPIFNGVMLAAVKRARGTIPVGDQTPILDPPADVEHAPVCTLSGARPN
ncbi:MAG TPA: transglycosylase domain-containing protein, partial [Thermoanaerobaculia bacterium]